VIQSLYPKWSRPISYRLFRCKTEEEKEDNDHVVVLIGLDKSMWKEWVLTRDNVVRVYGLVSHGRRVYRTILFTSDMRSCLYDLPPLLKSHLSYAAGNPFESSEPCRSLVIERNNETLIPSRLLRGAIPQALLESHSFWFSSSIIIGYSRNCTWCSVSTMFSFSSHTHSFDTHTYTHKTTANSKSVIHIKDTNVFNNENENVFRLANPAFITQKNNILRHLLRIESMSNILIWLDHKSSTICKVELPRLGLEFVPTKNRELFELKDRMGWYLYDYDNISSKNNEEESIFRRGIVLKNDCNDMIVLVPTHELRRCNTQLIPVHNSKSWNSTMRTFEPYVLYELHNSRSFVQCERLTGKLYLVFLKFIERQYASSSRLLESIMLDCDLTSSQYWILCLFYRFARTDAHPNAHATRLRIALCLRYNKRVLNDVVPDLSVQYERYLEKYAHLSKCCILNRDEETAISQMCRRVEPALISRWAYLRGDSSFQGTIREELGGRLYYEGMLCASDEILSRHRLCQDFRYILGDVNVLSDEQFVRILWDNTLMEDDEGGNSRGLGVLFLYVTRCCVCFLSLFVVFSCSLTHQHTHTHTGTNSQHQKYVYAYQRKTAHAQDLRY